MIPVRATVAGNTTNTNDVIYISDVCDGWVNNFVIS